MGRRLKAPVVIGSRGAKVGGEGPGRDGNRGRGGSSMEGGQMKGFKRAEESKM